MRFVDSRCIHCGATLRVAGDAKHVCCQYCNSELHIIHDGNRATTELVRAMHDGLSQKLDILRIQNDIERLDREWAMEREDYTTTNKDGSKSVPTVLGGIFTIVIAIVFGSLWLSAGSSMDTPGLFTAFGILMIGAIIVSGVVAIKNSNSHDSAETRYQSARRRLTTELAKAERASGVARK